MGDFGFGIVGTGMIAGVIAHSLASAHGTRLAAVSSRSQASADAFVAAYDGVSAVQGVEALLTLEAVEAVYVATPTTAKEAIALQAIAAGKHVLVDKPYTSEASAQRMIDAAAAKGLLFMDATHFTHHPRTFAIKDALEDRIGAPKSLHTAFYFPMQERDNIRLNTSAEPMGALGDMAWYSMRAAHEYLQPTGTVGHATVLADHDLQTGAIVRASGLIGFTSGEAATFDVGYTAGTAILDLSLVGTSGMIAMDDFVLDWTNSFASQNPSIPCGYVYRTGMGDRSEFSYIETPSEIPQDVLMMERFAAFATAGPSEDWLICAEAARRTQRYLDALWAAQADEKT